MIDLSKNINPYKPSKKTIAFLKKNISIIKKYPSSDTNEIELILANFFHVSNSNCCFVNGTMEGMNLILNMFKGKRICFFDPTFWGIKKAAKKNNLRIKEIPFKDNYVYDEDLISNSIKNCDVFYLCNPNNPTLSYIEKNKLISLIEKNPKCHFIVDETLLLFDDNFYKKSIIYYAKKFSNLSIIISLSKIYSLPGLRMGVIITNYKMKKELKKIKSDYSNNILNELFFKENFSKEKDVSDDIRKIKRNFDYLIKKINNKKVLKIIECNASFIIVEFDESIDTSDLKDYLKSNNILVSDLKQSYPTFKCNWIRLSAGTRKELNKFLKFIKKYLNDN